MVNHSSISAERPSRRIKPEFTEYGTPCFTVPWSVFPAVPVPQDFSVKTGEHIVFADGYACENGDGSFEHPFRDVQQAVDSLQSGDILCIRGGLYKLDRPIWISGKQDITISSYGTELAVFDGHGYDSDAPHFSHENGIFTIDRSADVVIRNRSIGALL